MGCGWLGYLAVAYIASRNGVWFGWGEPDLMALMVAYTWHLWPDPTDGSRYLFSRQDLQLPAVQEITRNKSPSLVVECGNSGLSLWAFR